MPLKRQTRHEHQERINDALHRIHRDLSASLDVKGLAAAACYSPYHFQRIFRQLVGESVHEYVRRSRLEWAANLLVFNPDESVMEVANACGFHSHASFSHAFKERFHTTPVEWRRSGYAERSRSLKGEWSGSEANPHRRYHQQTLYGEVDAGDLRVTVEQRSALRVAYVRHRGYDPGIRTAWERLFEWVRGEGLDPGGQQMIGLLHSNPDQVPFEECRYEACLSVPDDCYRSRGVGIMEIPGGLFASCRAEGGFGELLYLMRALYLDWLPGSGYQALAIPPHAQYLENHFLNESGRFVADFRVPIRLR